MRFFEILILIILTTLIGTGWWSTQKFRLGLSFCFITMVSTHLLWEGYRWQMIPIYFITLGIFFQEIPHLWNKKSRNTLRQKTSPFKTIIYLLTLAIAVTPPILLPIPSTPEPTGPYEVGTRTVLMVDNAREEIYSHISGESRKFLVQIWYPAVPEDSLTPGPWMENTEVIAPAIARYLGLPSFFLDHIIYATSHSYPGAKVVDSSDTYPILLFSHGWNGFRSQNTYQLEELASHGFIVIAPDHTYGAVASRFPDGSVKVNNPTALPSRSGLSEIIFMAAANRLGLQWSSDLSFILDFLQMDSSVGILTDLVPRMDFGKVGVLGHSTGGGAGINFCAHDHRCKLLLCMDPYLDPVSQELLISGLDIPLMGIFSEDWATGRDENSAKFEKLVTNSKQTVYWISIEGSAHYDFTDLPAFSPLAPALGLKGPINGTRVLQIINVYTLAFFEFHLKGEGKSILAGPSESFPEVLWVQSKR